MNKQAHSLRSALVAGIGQFERSRTRRRMALGGAAFVAALGLVAGLASLGGDGAEDQNVSASATAAPVLPGARSPVDSPTSGATATAPRGGNGTELLPPLDDPQWPQPSGGPGWRLLESIDAFTTEPEGPTGATTLEEVGDLEQRYGLNLESVNIDAEIVVAQMVIKALGPERRCGPHVIDNVRVVEGAFAFDLTTPGPGGSSDCPNGDSYQLFVVAMERDRLPDTLRLPQRAALIELQVREPASNATIMVSQQQSGCCYLEGSLGLLEVVDSNGQLAVPLSANGEVSQTGDGLTADFASEFAEIVVPRGRYTVSVWQYTCPGSPCSLDPSEWERQASLPRSDLCVAEVDLDAGQSVKMLAQWTLGTGCDSFTVQ